MAPDDAGNLDGPINLDDQTELDDRRARALSFGAVAGDYDRFRPGPPPEAVEWILPPRCQRVVDIGAGTGALTRLLVGPDRDGSHRNGPHREVVAVEPDRRMGAVLATAVPGAAVVSARAEQLPVGDGLFDAVVGSSMWHWVDAGPASIEVARVLRPGGVLGLLWSGPDRSQPWLAELLSSVRPIEHRPSPSRHRHRLVMGLAPEAPFSEPESHVIAWSLAVTPAHLVELACTYSGFIVLPETARARLRHDLVEAVDHHCALTDSSVIHLPMRCISWRAVRHA